MGTSPHQRRYCAHRSGGDTGTIASFAKECALGVNTSLRESAESVGRPSNQLPGWIAGGLLLSDRGSSGGKHGCPRRKTLFRAGREPNGHKACRGS